MSTAHSRISNSRIKGRVGIGGRKLEDGDEVLDELLHSLFKHSDLCGQSGFFSQGHRCRQGIVVAEHCLHTKVGRRG